VPIQTTRGLSDIGYLNSPLATGSILNLRNLTVGQLLNPVRLTVSAPVLRHFIPVRSPASSCGSVTDFPLYTLIRAPTVALALNPKLTSSSFLSLRIPAGIGAPGATGISPSALTGLLLSLLIQALNEGGLYVQRLPIRPS
jgi:hypothetical protein